MNQFRFLWLPAPALFSLVLLTLAVAGSSSAVAQATTAGLQGCVVDDTDQPVPGVMVELKNNASSKSAVAGQDGCFEILDLAIGNYALFARQAGFATTVDEVTLDVGMQQHTIDLSRAVETQQRGIDRSRAQLAVKPVARPPERQTTTTPNVTAVVPRHTDSSHIGPVLYNVTVILTKVRARASCDNLTDTDLMIYANVGTTDEQAMIVPFGWQVWPGGLSSKDVETGKNYRANKIFHIYHVEESEAIGIEVKGVDCDGDELIGNLFSLGSMGLNMVGVPIPDLGSLIGGGEAACEGEEGIEASGNPDFLGSAARLLEPNEWKRGFISLPIPGPRNNECVKRSAYTAFFNVQSRRVLHH